nr:8706_t:CDS:2 [Entrophospora candida]
MPYWMVFSKSYIPKAFNNNKNSQNQNYEVNSLIPPDFVEIETVETVKNLIEEAEEKLIKHDYVGSVELYQKAFQNGSAHAAGKLGVIYHGGLNGTISADHITASAYYFLALKLINTIPSNRWDMNLLLEVIGGISEIYRFQMDRSKEFDIWQTGVKAMRRIDQTLQDPIFCLYQKQQQSHVHSYLPTTKDDHENKIKAIRIHINYCLGLISPIVHH